MIDRRMLVLLVLCVLLGSMDFTARAQGRPKRPRRLHYDIAREHLEYLDNGTVRVGADIDLGGAITYLADAKNRDNIINNYDWGRQIQLSFYSGPVPYEPDGKKAHPSWMGIGWNPIQVGDVYGHRSRVLEVKNDGREIYIKSVPMHWPLDNVPGECTFETWITLDKNTVRLRGRINNNRTGDKTQYPARGQELPAVYTNAPLYRLFTYSGAKPFTNDALTSLPTENGTGFPWHHWQATEHWAALVREDGWGLGVYNPGAYAVSGGFSGKTGRGGSLDAPTGYLAPWHQDIIDDNIQYGFECIFIVGSLPQIRQYVYDHAARPAPPQYVFENDRQHWFYRNAPDAGWPIKGELNVDLSGRNPQLIGPADFWLAKDAPKLFIQAAFDVHEAGAARVFWKCFDESSQHPAKGRRAFDGSVAFNIIPDGQLHTYEIDLSQSPQYTGAITQLRIDPVAAGKPGWRMRVKSIGFKKVEAAPAGR